MKVSLFVTCLVDQIFPGVGMSTVELLRRLGCDVDFPTTQTCCGQPAFNSGYVKPAREAAQNHLRSFANSEYIVTPSGSCAGMVRHYYGELFQDDPALGLAASRLKTYELSEFLVDILGVEDVGARFPHRITYHPGCHAMRLLGISEQPLKLLRAVRDIEIVDLERATDCCGFGGTFAVKMSDISGAMVAEKCAHIQDTGAEYVVSGDMGCLMNVGGSLRRSGSFVKTIHLAEILNNVE